MHIAAAVGVAVEKTHIPTPGLASSSVRWVLMLAEGDAEVANRQLSRGG